MAERPQFLMQSFEVPNLSTGHYVEMTPIPVAPSGYVFAFSQTASFVIPTNDGREPSAFRTMVVAIVWWQRVEREHLDPYVRVRALELGWTPPEQEKS